MARITIPDAFPKLSEVATKWGKQVNEALKDIRSALGMVESTAHQANRAAATAVSAATGVDEKITTIIIPAIDAPQAIAAQPQDLALVSTSSAWDEYGRGFAEAILTWDGVELDVNGKPIDVAGYEILSATAGSVEVARNLVDDPSFETSIPTATGGTSSADTGWAASGARSAKLTPTADTSYLSVPLTGLVPGQAYTIVYTMRRTVVGSSTSSGYGSGVYGGPPTYGN